MKKMMEHLRFTSMRNFARLGLAALLLWPGCAGTSRTWKALEGEPSLLRTRSLEGWTPVVRLVNAHRARPMLLRERDEFRSVRLGETEYWSYTQIAFRRDDYVAQVDDPVRCNTRHMVLLPSGRYWMKTDVARTGAFTFQSKIPGARPLYLSAKYTGTRISMLAPAKGEVYELSRPFRVAWSPGHRPRSRVTISILTIRRGVVRNLPIYRTKDVGFANIDPRSISSMLGSQYAPANGAVYLVIEREWDDVVTVNGGGDGIVRSVDADAVSLRAYGRNPLVGLARFAGRRYDAKRMKVEMDGMANPIHGFKIKDIQKVGILSLGTHIRSAATGVEVDLSGGSRGHYRIAGTTKITQRKAKLGEANLKRILELMAESLAGKVASVCGATVLPGDQAKASAFRGRLPVETKAVDPKRAENSLYRGMMPPALDVSKPFSRGMLDLFELSKDTHTDLWLDATVRLTRKWDEGESKDDFTFVAEAEIRGYAYPFGVAEPYRVPSVRASWITKTYALRDGKMVFDGFVKALRYHEFVKIYCGMLEEYGRDLAAMGFTRKN